MDLNESEFLEYARKGASIRLAELDTETEVIYRAFPDLRTVTADQPVASKSRASDASGWSRAKREAKSKQMKQYWSKRRREAKVAK